MAVAYKDLGPHQGPLGCYLGIISQNFLTKIGYLDVMFLYYKF